MTKKPTAASLPLYHADRPATDPDEDRYNRAPFAAGIAKAILALPKGECFVIGVHGPWGDGKTSVLHFAASSLAKDRSTLVTWYNPWRFVNEEVMLAGFFSTLAQAIRLELKTKGEKIAGSLAEYGKLVAPVDDRASKAVDLLANKAAVSVEKLRDRLREGLRACPKRIVVFIDDMDRLDGSEVATLFRLIKASMDFPNVVYVLAFDREMVAVALGKMLADGGAEAGRHYLEKIVQVPLLMPPAAATDLDRACKYGVQEILKGLGIALDDQEVLRWNWAFREGVSRRLRTPRGVAQYLNAVRFALPMLAGEVNAVDLLLVEALRVFYPAAYEVIRTNQRAFIGAPVGEMERRMGHSPQEDLIESAKKDLSSSSADAIDFLVERLFPRYHVAKSGFVLGPETVKQWTRDKLVASPAYGPRYFSYAVGSSDVADRDVDAIVAAGGGTDTALVQPLLSAQLTPLRQFVLLSKLDDRSAGLSSLAATRLVIALATLSEQFQEPFSLQSMNDAGVTAVQLAARLCYGANADTRLLVAQQVVTQTPDMWFVAGFMRQVDPAHADPTAEPFLPPEHLQDLRQTFNKRFEKFAGSGERLLDLERRWKFEMLFSVARAVGRQRVHNRFVPQMHSDRMYAVRLLQCIAQPIGRSGENVPSPGAFELDDFDTLALLVDVDEVAKVINGWWTNTIPSDQWPLLGPDDRVLAEFVHGYPKWKEQTANTAHDQSSAGQGDARV